MDHGCNLQPISQAVEQLACLCEEGAAVTVNVRFLDGLQGIQAEPQVGRGESPAMNSIAGRDPAFHVPVQMQVECSLRDGFSRQTDAPNANPWIDKPVCLIIEVNASDDQNRYHNDNYADRQRRDNKKPLAR